MKKTVVSAILILCLAVSAVFVPLLSLGPVAAEAESPMTSWEKELLPAEQLPAFKSFLKTQLLNFQTIIDISSYNIPYDNAHTQALIRTLRYSFPEVFYVSNAIQLQPGNGKIKAFKPQYYITAGQYTTMFHEIDGCADAMVADLKNNAALSDAEKALLVHDRLAERCEYDYDNALSGTTPWQSYSIYGVLHNGVAVCEGYALAYRFLLEKLGIYSEMINSQTLNHAWNVVYLNGNAYFVDVTYDDPVYDISGYVSHDYFLLSNSAFVTGQHYASDYAADCTDTRFDHALWHNSNTAFQLIGGKLYYMDNSAQELKCWNDNGTLLSVQDTWKKDAGHYFSGNYARLVSNGTYLFYNLSRKIYRYDPATKTQTLLLDCSTKLTGYNQIYGLLFRNGNLIYEYYTTPQYTADVKKYNQVIVSSLGDIDGNGAVEAADATALARYLSHMDILTFSVSVADMNHDAKLNAVDLTLLAKNLARMA